MESILCQINKISETSQAQFLYCINIQNAMKAKILNVTDIYLLSNPLFLEAGQMTSFTCDYEPNSLRVKMTLESWQHYCYFYTDWQVY